MSAGEIGILLGVIVTSVFTIVAATLATRQRAQSDLIDDLSGQVDRLNKMFALQANYIADLRGHIYEQKPPPPPPFPEGLTR